MEHGMVDRPELIVFVLIIFDYEFQITIVDLTAFEKYRKVSSAVPTLRRPRVKNNFKKTGLARKCGSETAIFVCLFLLHSHIFKILMYKNY